MYRGDGSFKTKEIQQKQSLLDLLQEEKEYVDMYNTKVLSIELAKKNSLHIKDRYDELDRINSKMCKAREKIADYLQCELNMKTDIVNKLYGE